MNGDRSGTNVEELGMAALCVVILGTMASLLGGAFFAATRIAELAAIQINRMPEMAMMAGAF